MEESARKIILYSSLCKGTKEFCQEKVKFKGWILSKDRNCKVLQQYVNEWKTTLPLTTIISEVEQLLASWNLSEPPTVIIAQLDKIKEKVAALEEIVERLDRAYKRMKVLADRKGQAAAANDYISFVEKLDKLKIKEIDAAVKVLAPKILNEINAVINDYNDEKRIQSENIERANALKECVQPFLGYVDKHGNAEMCSTVLATVEEILNNSSAAPRVDKSRLDDAEKMLEDVDKAFKDEEKQFKKALAMCPNIWEEDKEALMRDELKLDPRETVFTIDIGEFDKRCRQLERKKQTDIESVKARYSKRVQKEYEGRFDDISKEDNYYYKNKNKKYKSLYYIKRRIDWRGLDIVANILAIIYIVGVIVLIVFFEGLSDQSFLAFFAGISAGIAPLYILIGVIGYIICDLLYLPFGIIENIYENSHFYGN